MGINQASQSVKIAKRRLLLQMHEKGRQGARGGQDLCVEGKTWPWVSAACQQSIFSITWGIISAIFQSRVLEKIQDQHKNQNNSSALSDCFHLMHQLKLVLRATKECESCLYSLSNAVFCRIGCPWFYWYQDEWKFYFNKFAKKEHYLS